MRKAEAKSEIRYVTMTKNHDYYRQQAGIQYHVRHASQMKWE